MLYNVSRYHFFFFLKENKKRTNNPALFIKFKTSMRLRVKHTGQRENTTRGLVFRHYSEVAPGLIIHSFTHSVRKGKLLQRYGLLNLEGRKQTAGQRKNI